MAAMMIPPKNRVLVTRFVLIGTHHAGNVGAAARALKTMGFDDLALVQPRDEKVLNRLRTKESASGAMNVLEKTQVFPSLEEALVGTDIWCATGMPNDMYRKRPERYTYTEPRPYFQELMNNHAILNSQQEENTEQIHKGWDEKEVRISFLFGNEKVGMREEDMDICHVILGIPTNPEFGSLNLASAVQLIAYDWRQALGGF